MEINSYIIKILDYIRRFGGSEITDSLKVNGEHASIISGKKILIRISQDSILLLDKYGVQNNILLKNAKRVNTIQLDKIEEFLEDISKSIIRLNHVGISYSCKNYRNEINKYAKILDTNFKIFQEESDSADNKWFFIRDLSSWKSPLFEIVLTKSQTTLVDKWTPHFQIDIDTSLDAETLEKKLISTFGTGFDWSLNIPNFGVVLGMKILGSVNGTKICLGIGTAKRGTEYHRKNIQKEYR